MYYDLLYLPGQWITQQRLPDAKNLMLVFSISDVFPQDILMYENSTIKVKVRSLRSANYLEIRNMICSLKTHIHLGSTINSIDRVPLNSE